MWNCNFTSAYNYVHTKSHAAYNYLHMYFLDVTANSDRSKREPLAPVDPSGGLTDYKPHYIW